MHRVCNWGLQVLSHKLPKQVPYVLTYTLCDRGPQVLATYIPKQLSWVIISTPCDWQLQVLSPMSNNIHSAWSTTANTQCDLFGEWRHVLAIDNWADQTSIKLLCNPWVSQRRASSTADTYNHIYTILGHKYLVSPLCNPGPPRHNLLPCPLCDPRSQTCRTMSMKSLTRNT